MTQDIRELTCLVTGRKVGILVWKTRLCSCQVCQMQELLTEFRARLDKERALLLEISSDLNLDQDEMTGEVINRDWIRSTKKKIDSLLGE